MAKKAPKPEVQPEANPAVIQPDTPETAGPVEQASPATTTGDIDAAFEEAVSATLDETNPAPDAPISFAEPAAEVDHSKAAFSDEANGPAISPEMMAALQVEAGRDNDMRDFTLKVLAARAKPEVPAAMPPIADRVRSQTEAEMAAGAKMNKHYEELHARHRPRVAAEPEGSKAVFRPGDYVPDPKKGQGIVASRNL